MAVINRVLIQVDDCKGCGLCVDACPVGVLDFSDGLNSMGYRPAHYKGVACTGCGTCFYTCPEPGAITVIRNVESLEKGNCKHCGKTVFLIPDSRDPSRKRCIDCHQLLNEK